MYVYTVYIYASKPPWNITAHAKSLVLIYYLQLVVVFFFYHHATIELILVS